VSQSAWTGWEAARRSLDETRLDARVFRLAGGWTGFSIDDPNRYIPVAAFNMADASVSLDEVEAASYGFDLSTPYRIGHLQDAQSESQSDLKSLMRARTVHPDHEAVMAASPWFE
jgi:hypothetical protein